MSWQYYVGKFPVFMCPGVHLTLMLFVCVGGNQLVDAHEFFISTVDGIHANSGTTSPRARHSQGGRYAQDKAVLLQSPFAH
jgi:hypothetical protein